MLLKLQIKVADIALVVIDKYLDIVRILRERALRN